MLSRLFSRSVLSRSSALIVCLISPLPVRAENAMQAPAPAVAHFVTVADFDFAHLVPAPPEPGSLAARADLEAVLQAQAWRTPDQIAWAKVVERDDAFLHAEILGPWFAPQHLPLAAAFFKDLADDLHAVDATSKKPFLRPRPPAVDPRVQPCVAVPASTSYPSGSALQAFVWAELLGEALPEKREALLARAHRAGWGRVIGGVHYPSDLVAGRMLADAFLRAARENPAFRERWTACREELIAAAKAAR
jgi:acid phosphatase (class A)